MISLPIASDLARRATEQAINDPRPPRPSVVTRVIAALRSREASPEPRQPHRAWRQEPQTQ